MLVVTGIAESSDQNGVEIAPQHGEPVLRDSDTVDENNDQRPVELINSTEAPSPL